MLIKSQLYCLLILRPQSDTRERICTSNLLTLDQVPLLVGLREQENDAGLRLIAGLKHDQPEYRMDARTYNRDKNE